MNKTIGKPLVVAALVITFALLPQVICSGQTNATDFEYKADPNKADQEMIITGYTGDTVSIPTTIGGEKVSAIGEDAFSGKGLTGIIIPNGITTIGDRAFSDNQLTRVTIPNSVATIGNGAFSNNQLTSVAIPNSVTTIGDRAFSDNRLTSVTIPNSVATIGEGAFFRNRLASVAIGSNVALGYYYDGSLLSGLNERKTK
jgi:hypothetical protein